MLYDHLFNSTEIRQYFGFFFFLFPHQKDVSITRQNKIKYSLFLSCSISSQCDSLSQVVILVPLA